MVEKNGDRINKIIFLNDAAINDGMNDFFSEKGGASLKVRQRPS